MVDSLFVIIIWFLIIYFCKDTNYFHNRQRISRLFSLWAIRRGRNILEERRRGMNNQPKQLIFILIWLIIQ